MNTKRTLIAKTLVVVVLIAASIPAMADRGEGGWRGGEGWRGRDIRYFDRGDMGIWRGGRWIHEIHDDRWGWWWVAGGMWYFYPQPVYPYPDPYIPPVVVVQPNVAPAPQAAGQFWYYCQANNGYYPYVASCPTGWSTVPAIPPAAPAAVVPPAPPDAATPQYR